MKHLLLTLTVIGSTLIASPAFAAETVNVSVKGMVCDFCARSLEKVFGKKESVEDISVDLDTKIITIDMVEGATLSDEEITEMITDSGYNVDSIERIDE